MIIQCRGRRSAARARASPHCQCCRFSDLLSMTPYLAALTAAGAAPPRRLEPVALLGAAAADASAPRPVQVGLPQSSLELAPPLARA